MIWVGLLGAAYVSGKNEHLAIRFITSTYTSFPQEALAIVYLLDRIFIRCICIDRRWDLAGIHSFSFGSYFGFLRD